jgi:TonB-dependent receptor
MHAVDTKNGISHLLTPGARPREHQKQSKSINRSRAGQRSAARLSNKNAKHSGEEHQMPHKSRKRKHGQLVGFSTGLTAALAASGALAQEAQPVAAAANTEEIETVTVRGTRASLKSALERKRAADTVSDSIVAEDIAQFPDKNVAEALSRVTGVQLSRDFGEGVQVSIRGVAPDLNRVEINGMSVLTANGASQRGADLRELASELVKSIDVVKGSTADMTEGGIGGTVQVELRKPLELDGPLFSAALSGQELSTMGGWTPRANITTGTKFFDERFGILANVTYDEVITRQDYLRNTEWVRLGDWDESPDKTIVSLDERFAAQTTEAGCTSAFTVQADRDLCRQQWWDYSPRIARYGIWYREDKRLSAQITGQVRLNDQNDVYFEATRTERKQYLNDHNYGTDFTAVNRVSTVTNNVYDSLAANSNVTVDENHNVTAYTVANNAAGAALAFGTSSRGFDLRNTTDYLGAGYNFVSDRFAAQLRWGSTDSERYDQTNSANFTANIPGLRVELDGQGVPRFIFPTGFSMEDDNVYSTMQLQYRPTENELTEDLAQADFDFNTEWPFLTGFEAGLQMRDTKSLQYGGGGYLDAATGVNVPTKNINLTANLVNGTQANVTTPGTNINAQHITYTWNTATFREALAHSRRSPGTFYDGYDGIANIPTDWRVPVFDDLAPMFDTSNFSHDGIREILVNGVLYEQIPGHEVTEDTFAQYFKLNFEQDFGAVSLRGNVGVRYIQTETSAAGVLTRRERRPTGATTFTDVTVGNLFVAIDRDYTDTLPSANLLVSFGTDGAQNFNVRMGFAELLARPPIADLAPAANCLFDLRPGFAGDTDADDCTAGNPALKPYRAKSYDLEFAWYPTDEIEVRVGGFYKDVETFVLARTLVRNVDLFGDGTLFDVTQPINGEGAKTQGFETSMQAPFTFLPGWAAGFGGVVNYTYSEAKDVGLFSQLDGSELPFPGLSEHTYNLELYYDRGPINARVAWNSRTDWLQSAADRSGNPVFRKGEDYLDARFQYRFLDDRMSVFVEGKNLTDQALISTAGSDIRLSELGWPGRRYFVGFTYKN